MNLTEIPKKELFSIFKKLSEYYGIEIEFLESLFDKYVFFRNKKGKVYIVPKDIYKLVNNLRLNINKYGLYIFTIDKRGIRFSIEGAQLFYKYIKKHKLEVDSVEWFSSDIVQLNTKVEEGFYVVYKKNDVLGTGYVRGNSLQSFIPKNRKIQKSIKLSKNKNSLI